MANKKIFSKFRDLFFPQVDSTNEAGGVAYRLEDKHALAQLAATGCLNSTFYAGAEQQLDKTLALAGKLEPEFVAKTAIYSRERGYMKDMPALLLAHLATRSPELLARIFPRVIDSPKMLRNFVQIVRSGTTGRRSLGSLPKRLVRQWLASRSDDEIFAGAVGSAPSLADVVKMVHPKPESESRRALYAYLIGRDHRMEELPESVQRFEAYKADKSLPLPEVSFQYLTSLDLGTEEWAQIAERASWTMTRMNLNTFERHGVLKMPGIAEKLAERLADPQQVKKARAFPYQLLVAYKAATGMPRSIKNALHDAMEVAIANVPEIEGKIYVLPDVSGSMHSPATGFRQGSTSGATCLDVAALVAAALLRRNKDAEVIPFSDDVVPVSLEPRDTVMTNATTLANLPSGGTNCSAPLRWLNKRKALGDVVIYVSDNESWLDSGCHARIGRQATETMEQWRIFKERNESAKLICLDIQPYTTTQAKEREDVVNVGGFSDEVFRLFADVAKGNGGGYWAREIEKIEM